MRAFIHKHHRLLFYSTWLALNLLQAYFTELFDDESYYWIYSIFPTWGYFDHPPMIAWLIKLGMTLFSGEFGLRFFVVLLNTASLYLIEELTDRKNPFLFYGIATSIVVAQIGGIIAVPDLPLMFFVALFFVLYRRFTDNPGYLNSILLGVSIALMLYSKYHGVLIVFFTLLSNLELLRKRATYLTAIVALLLFLPHLHWQWVNDFPSVQYHLFERNAKTYQLSFTLEYLAGQILLAGPLLGWLLIYGSLKATVVSPTDRALKFTLVGIYLFFLLSSLKGRVEANWTLPAFVSLIVLAYRYIEMSPRWKKWVYRSLPATLLIVICLRTLMAAEVVPASTIPKNEFHNNRQWISEVRQKAGDGTVVILDSYQKPSKYWFYSGDKAFGMNTPLYRRNNYNFWPLEDSLFGKRVYALGPGNRQPFAAERFKAPLLVEYGGVHIPHFYSFTKIRLEDVSVTIDSLSTLEFKAIIPPNYLSILKQSPYDTARLYVAVLNESKPIVQYYATGFLINALKSSEQRVITSLPALPPGRKFVKLGISSCIPGFPSLNSTGFYIDVK